ncbi:MAG TPA: pilus assembly protein N-terminal domain-containing protein [bacterium]|nr:pilus assembly protein N-terminal domain-containing protein [bacterium]
MAAGISHSARAHRGVCGTLVAALAAAAVWGAPPDVDRARAAGPALGGVVIEPDGEGARIRIAVGAPVRYAVSTSPGRVLIALEGVAVEPASYRLAVGPVVGIFVRPIGGAGSRSEIEIATRIAMHATARLVDGRVLVVVVAPPTRLPVPDTPSAHPGSSRTTTRGAATPPPVGSGAPQAMTLQEGSGRLLSIAGLVRVAVADPRVLSVVPVTDRELLVTARAAGRTTMYVWDGAGRVSVYAVEVASAPDRLAALRHLLSTMFPGAALVVTEIPSGGAATNGPAAPPAGTSGGVPAPGSAAGPRAGLDVAVPPSQPTLVAVPGGTGASTPRPGAPVARQPSSATSSGVVLSGSVETQMDRQRIEEIARAFVPLVVNLLNVRRPVQIKLQVEVVELDRSAARALGVTWGGGQAAPGAAPSLNGGVYNLQLTTNPGAGAAGLDLLIAQLQGLVQDGRARLLAEPSLMVMAGTPASMLLGGQVPIPIAGPNGSVTVEYKDFGVILTARPDYQDDGRVFMQVAPEVSTLDFTDAIKVNGFTIPALRVRRAQTAVSMLPNQTLVLGGLLQRQDSESVQKIPVLGDLPVIGALFRSTQFQHDETELVIFVTPMLVDPSDVPAPRP